MDTLDIKLERIIPVGAVSKAHSELEGLGYEESGHIGFASSEEVSAINERLGNVEKDYLKGEDKVSLQEQINTNAEAIRVLSDGIDPEKIDGLKEVAEYVNEHIEEVIDINKRLSAVEKSLDSNLLSEEIVLSFEQPSYSSDKEIEGLNIGDKATITYVIGDGEEQTANGVVGEQDGLMGLTSDGENPILLGKYEDMDIGLLVFLNTSDMATLGGSSATLITGATNYPTIVIKSLSKASVEYASKEEVEALGEEVDMLKIGEPLVATFQIMSANTQVTAQYMQDTKYIDWGDGTNIEAIDYSATKVFTHTYEKTGMFNAKFYGMTSMNGNCFDNQTKLRYVVIPETITSIGSYSFRGCTSLSSVSIPQRLSSIGERAFYGCSALEHINLENITVINDTAFGQCKKLETIKVDRRCSVWGAAFSGATALKTARFNNGASFYGGVFRDCTALKTVTVAGDMSTSKYGNDLISTTAKLIVPYDQLESYKTDEQWSKMASQIDSYALASELENIGGSSTPSGEPLVATFSISSSNTSITVKNLTGATMVDWGDGSAIEDISSVTTYTHTYTTTNTYFAKFYNVASFGSSSFKAIQQLIAISLPSQIKATGLASFADCSVLKNVCLGKSIESIAEDSFKGCTRLKRVTIPSSVTRISNNAFADTGLLEVVFEGAPPTINGYLRIVPTTTKIIVPYSYLSNYKSNSTWSPYISQIDAYAMASDIDNINTALTNIIEGEGV